MSTAPNWTASLRRALDNREVPPTNQGSALPTRVHTSSAHVQQIQHVYPTSAKKEVVSSDEEAHRRSFAYEQLCAPPMTHYAENHYLQDLLQWCAKNNVFIHPAVEIRHERSAYRDFSFRLKFPVPRHTPLIAVPEELVIGFKEDVSDFDRNALFDAQKETTFFKANHGSENTKVPALSNSTNDSSGPQSDADICDFFFYCLGTIVADLVTAQSSQLTDVRYDFARNLARIRTLQNAPYLPDNIVFASRKNELESPMDDLGPKGCTKSQQRGGGSTTPSSSVTAASLAKAPVSIPLGRKGPASVAPSEVESEMPSLISTPSRGGTRGFNALKNRPTIISKEPADQKSKNFSCNSEKETASPAAAVDDDTSSVSTTANTAATTTATGVAGDDANVTDEENDDPTRPTVTETEDCSLADILLQMIRNYINGGPLVGKLDRPDLMSAVSMCLSHSTPLIIGPKRSIGIVPLVHLFPHGGKQTNAVVIGRPDDSAGEFRTIRRTKWASLSTKSSASSSSHPPISAALEMAQYFSTVCGYDFTAHIDDTADGKTADATRRNGGVTRTKGFVYVVALRDMTCGEAIHVQAMAPVCTKEEESLHMWHLSCGTAPSEYLPTTAIAEASHLTLAEILGMAA